MSKPGIGTFKNFYATKIAPFHNRLIKIVDDKEGEYTQWLERHFVVGVKSKFSHSKKVVKKDQVEFSCTKTFFDAPRGNAKEQAGDYEPLLDEFGEALYL